jgi:arylsulfatase A-like enzyme
VSGTGPAAAARIARDEVGACLGAALVLAAVEGFFVREPGAVVVGGVLLLGLGLAAGAALLAVETIVRRASLGAVAAAMVRAAAALPALAFVSRDLFEGARAATLPGAAWGTLWVPALGWAAVSVLLLAGARLVRSGRRARAAVSLALVSVAVLAEFANRSLYRSEYPDVHAFLVALSLVSLALAARVAAGPAAPGGTGVVVARAVAAAVVLGALHPTIAYGLESPESRWAVATRGTHTRELVRIVRAQFDRDGDGYSRVLGGGDCDDDDPNIHPGAVDIPGDGIDQDCSGFDAPLPKTPDADAAPDLALLRAELRARADVNDLIDATGAMNVVIIVIDALRADVLHESGANRSAFPHLFRFLDQARVFRRAFAPSAGTDLSVGAILTGRIDPFVVLDTTLVEAIQRSGRGTRAVLPTEVLRYAGEVLIRRGLDRLHRYVNDPDERDVGSHTTSVRTTDLGLRALDELTRAGSPFYLWLHYFDVHETAQVERDDRGLLAIAGSGELSFEDKYRALVALTDREVGRFLAAMDERGLADHTIVVLLSDHGESLGEDPRLPEKHGRFVYNPLVHVPLAIRIPGVAPAAVDVPVSLVDVMPTLLELLDQELPAEMDGWSLLPHLVEDPPPELTTATRAVVLNEQEQWGVIEWPFKLMVRAGDNLVELYDLERDFAEQRDLSKERGEEVARLKARYAEFPRPSLDRSRAGRQLRDERARPPRRH